MGGALRESAKISSALGAISPTASGGVVTGGFNKLCRETYSTSSSGRQGGRPTGTAYPFSRFRCEATATAANHAAAPGRKSSTKGRADGRSFGFCL